MALRAIGRRNPALPTAAGETAERLAGSDQKAARSIGKRAAKELGRQNWDVAGETAMTATEPTRVARPDRPSVAVGPIALVVGVKLVLQLVFLTGYGWHRDEFYYLIGGRHLEIGYVDHPLLAPWVARGVDLVFGPSLPALRVVPALLGAATVLLTALLAREFGGGRMAQTMAALCVALDPAFLAINHWFQTPSFDALAWVALSYALARVLRGSDPRRWLAVGVAAAVGVLSKGTILVWIAALGVGLVATPARRRLREPLAAVAAGMVVLAGLPFLWFQVRHGWPFVEFTDNMTARTGGEEQPLFVPGQLFLHNPISAFVWIPGLWALWRDRGLAPYRAFGWAYAVAFVLFLATRGKAYYLAPAYPVLFAAGAVFLARRWRGVPKLLVAGLAVSTLIALPGVLPVLAIDDVKDTPYAGINEDILEQVGWPRFVDTVSRVVAEQPGPTTVIAANYGEAGALDVLGNLDTPVRSPHNSYWLWGREPPSERHAKFVMVGWRPDDLGSTFAGCRLATHFDNGEDVDNEEQGAPITVCDRLVGSWTATWNELRHFT